MKRTLVIALTAATVPLASTMLATSTARAAESGRPSSYSLTGDEGGSKFEGIGVDARRGTLYVSEVTGGEIHRGSAMQTGIQEWLGGAGTDGRFTARGITTDHAGRVYVAGGPNGIDASTGTDNGRPDLWVYSPSGELLAALRTPGDNAFLNDVWVGPDGAAYFTNSNAPQVFRVALEDGVWGVDLWADATETIPQLTGFNLGGIVLSPDRSAFVVAQGTTGRLWRFAVADGAVSEVETGGADLVNADGLVRQGTRLTVVRNFSRMLATLELSGDGSSASLVSQEPTDPTRVLTTAKTLRGRTLFVDSKFDETVATPPYEVVTNPFAS
ncbi:MULTISPECIES: SMP-30/gluconolactonase/LRE family protein [unclassified Knoellia]|uniref:SMP-30/gluconolactonase/LRE family protein n=1 Tax=Knoellia altitudinis TaxID=3404795 RepID=UPI003607AA78